MTNTECRKCDYNKECVNVNRFIDGDCLTFSGQVRTPELKEPQPKENPRYRSTKKSRMMIDMLFDNKYENEDQNEYSSNSDD